MKKALPFSKHCFNTLEVQNYFLKYTFFNFGCPVLYYFTDLEKWQIFLCHNYNIYISIQRVTWCLLALLLEEDISFHRLPPRCCCHSPSTFPGRRLLPDADHYDHLYPCSISAMQGVSQCLRIILTTLVNHNLKKGTVDAFVRIMVPGVVPTIGISEL